MTDSLPSFDRPAVSRPAAATGPILARALDLTGYRLAGGTALAWALQHRRSDDLDFFTREPGRQNAAAQVRLADRLRALEGADAVHLADERTLHAVVGDCKISFFEIGGRWLRDPIPTAEGVWLASIDDIAAMKVVSVLTRSAKKDFYDMHALDRAGYSGQHLFELARAAVPEIDAEVADQLVRALADFTDAELDPDPISLDGTTWAAARRTSERLSREISSLLRRGRLP